MYYLWLISEALLESLFSLGSSPFFTTDRKDKGFAESPSGVHKKVEELQLSSSLRYFISTELAQHYIEGELPPLFAKIRQEHGLREMDAGALHANEAGLIKLKIELGQGVGVHETYGYKGDQILAAIRTEVVAILNEGSSGKLARIDRTAPYRICDTLNNGALTSRLKIASDHEVDNYFECRTRFGKFSYIRPDVPQLDLRTLSKTIETLLFAGEKQSACLATDIPIINQMFAEAAEKGLVLVCHETDEEYNYE